jgi:hypothetical protein
VQIPRRGKIYSFNEANRFEWDTPLVDYVSAIQQGKVGRQIDRTDRQTDRETLALAIYQYNYANHTLFFSLFSESCFSDLI